MCNQLIDFVINTLNLRIGKFSVIRQTQVRNVNITLSCAFVTFNRILDLQLFYPRPADIYVTMSVGRSVGRSVGPKFFCRKLFRETAVTE